jgi:adenylate cyclase
VALHIGDVTHGTLAPGTLTMLGDTVNTTFRIQSLTRTLGSDIIASSEFFETWPDWIAGKEYCHPLGIHDLKGRLAQVELWGVDSCPGDYGA